MDTQIYGQRSKAHNTQKVSYFKERSFLQHLNLNSTKRSFPQLTELLSYVDQKMFFKRNQRAKY